MYKVQSILDKRIDPKTKMQQYLIKWEGYELDVSTWEPIEHLSYCLDLVDAFDKKYGHLPTTSFGTLDPNPMKKSNRQNKLQKKRSQNMDSLWQKRLRVKEEVLWNPQDKIDNNENDEHKNEKKSSMIQMSRSSESKLRNRNRRKQNEQNNEEPELGLDSILKLEREISRRAKLQKQHQSREKVDEDSHQRNRKSQVFQPLKITKKISKNNLQLFGKKRGRKNVVIIKKQQQEQNDQNLRKNINEQIYEEEGSQIEREEDDRGEMREQEDVLQEEEVERREKEEERVKILGMRRADQYFEFYLQKGEIQGWSTHTYILDNYPRELCAFYEKHIEFD